jgi:DNA repair ATPase RecN
MKKHSRDLRVCLAQLRSVHSNSNLKPEQKSQIEMVIDRVKGLARKKNPSQADIFACVREVSERLVHVLLNND